MTYRTILCCSLLFLMASCQKNSDAPSSQNTFLETEITAMQFPSDFDFSTTYNLKATVIAKDINNQPLAGKRLNFFDADPEAGGQLLSSAILNPAGMLEIELSVPTYVEEVFVQINAYGIPNLKSFPSQADFTCHFGLTNAKRDLSYAKTNASQTISPISANYYYHGSFNSQGVPDYLEPVGDALSSQFLSDVNASLPERRPVPVYNPQYLSQSNQLDVVVNDRSDIWVSFVHEGAGYRNALAYYSFDTDNPPASAADIDSIIILMPNTSFAGSGGGLYSGDKVKLGTFSGGKTISWVLFQNAWNGTGVNVNSPKFYSNSDFNPEVSSSDRQHTVQLADIGRQLLLNSFEDINRSSWGCDHDFNDLIFYVTANPWENVSIGNVPGVKPSTDCDNDGVSDEADDFPCDASRAVRNTYTGALAYEDLWPSQGDYDFNDLVVDYAVDHILNGANKLVEIEADWTVKAVGAGFRNGFGWSFDGVDPNIITTVGGQNLDAGLITNSSNGTESSQSQAVIIAFDDVFKVMPHSGGQFINTIVGQPTSAPQTISTTVSFSTPQEQSYIGLPPYNPFIFSNADRGREIHLANQLPTDLADNNRFGNGADATDLNAAYTYKTLNGLPWAIHIAEPFDYPIEFTAINEAYLNFGAWATGGGEVYKDWYTVGIGNRVDSKLF